MRNFTEVLYGDGAGLLAWAAMHRIGELLRAEGLLTAEQLDAALRAQAMWGGRLGTIMIELGFIDLDGLSRALGRQHDLPAAIAQHFDVADRTLQDQLPVELAERYTCIPLYRIETEQVVVVAPEPLDDSARAAIAGALGIAPDKLFPAIAAELRVRYQLDRVYQIPLEPRSARRRGSDTIELTPELREQAVAIAAPPARDLPHPVHPSFMARGTRRDVHIARGTRDNVVSDGVPAQLPVDESHKMPAPQPPALGRVPVKRMAHGTDVHELLGATLGEATRTIRRGTERSLILAHTIATIEHFIPTVDAALMMLCAGDRAVCGAAFARDRRPLPDMAIPLDAPGLVPAVIRRNAALRGTASELGVLDTLLLETCGRPDGELLVLPLSTSEATGSRALGALAFMIERDALVHGADTIAAAAGAALARLERDATR